MYTDKSPEANEPVLIIDSSADISCVRKGFRILFYTGEITSLGVAFSSTEPHTFNIVTAAAVINATRLSTPIIIIINQAAYIPNDDQYESLLHNNQACHHNVIINDLACCYVNSHRCYGKQSIEIHGHIVRHDGLKCFLTIREPTDFDWNHCHVVKLTSPLP
jgi:hypothetical protein